MTDAAAGREVGYDLPAAIGMQLAEVQTPCLVLELDALERNLRRMRRRAEAMGVGFRAHGKMHRSVDVARLQMQLGGALGLCCQKVSEAEAFVRGGIGDILVSNQIRDPVKIDRLARLPGLGARILCCVDDPDNVAELSAAATRRGSRLECLLEVDMGSHRCGVASVAEALAIAEAIRAADGLDLAGVQAYFGSNQHVQSHADRAERFRAAAVPVAEILAALRSAGFACPVVSGGGTGGAGFEGASGLYTELQCGSYAFMDVDYGRVLDAEGRRLDAGEWENALFVLTSVMSRTVAGQAVCDAGLKSLAVDSGLPEVYRQPELVYARCSDEHGVIRDPDGVLRINQRLRLVPGHCDPTCNLHDWYVGMRGGRVETLWPVTARGKSF